MEVIMWSKDVGGGEELERVNPIDWDLVALFSSLGLLTLDVIDRSSLFFEGRNLSAFSPVGSKAFEPCVVFLLCLRDVRRTDRAFVFVKVTESSENEGCGDA